MIRMHQRGSACPFISRQTLTSASSSGPFLKKATAKKRSAVGWIALRDGTPPDASMRCRTDACGMRSPMHTGTYMHTLSIHTMRGCKIYPGMFQLCANAFPNSRGHLFEKRSRGREMRAEAFTLSRCSIDCRRPFSDPGGHGPDRA